MKSKTVRTGTAVVAGVGLEVAGIPVVAGAPSLVPAPGEPDGVSAAPHPTTASPMAIVIAAARVAELGTTRTYGPVLRDDGSSPNATDRV